ncbi:hypothetical protein Tco_1217304 [Tanacetum coccineum]
MGEGGVCSYQRTYGAGGVWECVWLKTVDVVAVSAVGLGGEVGEIREGGGAGGGEEWKWDGHDGWGVGLGGNGWGAMIFGGARGEGFGEGDDELRGIGAGNTFRQIMLQAQSMDVDEIVADDDEALEEDPVGLITADGRKMNGRRIRHESSEDDEDDDMDIEADDDEEEEEEEHPASADSVVVALLAADQAPSAEETEPFETDESAATPPPHPALSLPEVARLLAISTPPSSPLSPWSSPLPQIPSPSLPLSPPSPVLSPAPPPSPIRSLGYRAAMIRLRISSDAPSSGIPPPLPISVPTSSPPFLLPSASRREDKPEVTLPPRQKLGIALGPRYEVGESSSAAAARPAGGLRAYYGFVANMDRDIRRDPEREVGYEITDLWDEIVVTLQGAPISTNTELGRHMIAFETRVRQDTDEIYTRLDDEQSQRQLLASRLNMLFRDRRAHAYTHHL